MKNSYAVSYYAYNAQELREPAEPDRSHWITSSHWVDAESMDEAEELFIEWMLSDLKNRGADAVRDGDAIIIRNDSDEITAKYADFEVAIATEVTYLRK